MNDSTTQCDLGPAPARDGFLVLGMHRSGTSSVAGTIARLGPVPPKTPIPAGDDNRRGYWESLAITELHNELLASAGSKWNDWRLFNSGWRDTPVAAQFKARAKALLESEFNGASAFVLKDPRICRFPEFWLEIFQEENITPRIVIPVRVPLEVAQSLKTRNGFSLSEGLLLWLRHVLDAEAATRDMPRAIIMWDAFLKDWRCEIERIGKDLNIHWPGLTDFTAAEIDTFLTAELKHERTAADTARVHPDMHEWVMAVYDALVELSRNPSSNSARATLDDVKADFNQASRLFGRTLAGMELERKTLGAERSVLVADRDARAQELQQTLQTLEAERARSAELQRTHDEALQSLRNELDAQGQALLAEQQSGAEARQTAQALEEDRNRLAALHQGHDEALNALRAELEAERARLTAEIRLHQQELQRSGQVLESETARFAALQHEKEIADSNQAELATKLAELDANFVNSQAGLQHAESERDVTKQRLEDLHAKIARFKKRPIRSLINRALGRGI